MLFPRYVNIRRGCVIAAIVGGWVIVPWKILTSATTFLAFMGGYAVFLAPFAGIIASDYWLVKKRHIDVPALYDPHGRYRYWYGINWQGMLAFLLAVGPNLPGLAYSINTNTKITAGAKNLYSFDWLFGFLVSIVAYTSLSKIFPNREAEVPHTIDGVEILEGRKGSDEETGSTNMMEKNPNGGKGFGNVDAVDPGKDF